MKRCILLCLLSLVMLLPVMHASNANFINHYAAKAKSGDGVITLMKRYGLKSNSCDRAAFYQLNNLKKDAPLLKGKTYTLPIRIYKYNKKSIRSTVGRDDWDMAKSIASYNRLLKSKGIKKTYYLEDNVLYVPYHLTECTVSADDKSKSAMTKPAAPEKVYRTNSLYGKHSKYEVISDELKDQAFYIIAGHGGPDPGAMCSHGTSDLCEDEYAYDVCVRLARNIESRGGKVFMIIQDKSDGLRDEPLLDCDKDEVCFGGAQIPLSQKLRLRQRVDITNKLYKQHKKKYKSHKVIAVHVDSRPQDRRQDVFFYNCPGSAEGKRIANNIHEVFRQKYKKHRADGKYFGTVSERKLYVLRHTDPAAVYVELANIKNHRDQRRIIQPSNRQYLADWLMEGLIK